MGGLAEGGRAGGGREGLGREGGWKTERVSGGRVGGEWVTNIFSRC